MQFSFTSASYFRQIKWHQPWLRNLIILAISLLIIAAPALFYFSDSGPSAQAAPMTQFSDPIVTTITVDSGDDPESSSLNHTCTYEQGAFFFPAADGKCTFRRALREAAGRPQSDRPIAIEFNIPTSDSGYDSDLQVFVITLDTEMLPPLETDTIINKNGQVLIDGSTQPNTRGDGPGIVIDNSDYSLEIESTNNIIRNLSFRGGGAIFLKEGGNVVENIWMGISDDGQEIAFREPSNPWRMAGGGIFISSDDNTIQNNTISGAFAKAIDVGSGSLNTIITKNNIGTRPDGNLPPINQALQCFRSYGGFDDIWYGGWGISLGGTNVQLTQNRIAGLAIPQGGGETSPPAIETYGGSHVVQNNIIGRTQDGTDVGICGTGIKIAGDDITIIDNTIVRTKAGFEGSDGDTLDGAILINDGSPLFDKITMRRNIVIDGPGTVHKFGPAIKDVLKLFEPAQITSISGTTVVGTSGAGSPCPACRIDFYLDDLDEAEEALQHLGDILADADGNFTFALDAPLAAGQTIRTSSTTQSDNVISGYSAGMTTKFSDLYGGDGMVVTPNTPTPTATRNLTPEPVDPPTVTPTATSSPTPEATTAPITIITVDTITDPNNDSRNFTCGFERGALYFPSTDGLCSFRRAWIEANGRPPEDRPIMIQFNIPAGEESGDVAGTWVVEISKTMQGLNPDNSTNDLSSFGGVTIDGSTQPGGRIDGPPIIISNNDYSLEIEGSDNVIKNIAMRGGGAIFLKAISNQGGGSNLVENIWMGLTDDGQDISFREPGNPRRMAGGGVFINSDNNIVRNNVISGAFAKAVDINSGNVNNLIVDNYIGTRADGTVPAIDPAVECSRSFSVDAGSWYGGWGIAISGSNNHVLDNVIAGLHILQSANDTPPMAIEIFGSNHRIEGNSIGRDLSGSDVGVCGQGIKIAGSNHQVVSNTIVRSRKGFENELLDAILSNDGSPTFGQNTIRENIVVDSPERIHEMGPAIPDALRFFNPGRVTKIEGTAVTGTSGVNSYCPNCLIDFYLDELEPDVAQIGEALEFLGSALADSNGNFTFTLPQPLTDQQGLRTMSTGEDLFGVPYGPGTTTKSSRLFYEAKTLTIDGPTAGDPFDELTYSIVIGPPQATLPLSVTLQVTDFPTITVDLTELPSFGQTFQWATGGTKVISITAKNDLSIVSGTFEVQITGEEATPTPTPSSPDPTATPSSSDPTATPSSSDPTATPSSSDPTAVPATAVPEDTATPVPQDTATPVPQATATPVPQATADGSNNTSSDGKVYLPFTTK